MTLISNFPVHRNAEKWNISQTALAIRTNCKVQVIVSEVDSARNLRATPCITKLHMCRHACPVQAALEHKVMWAPACCPACHSPIAVVSDEIPKDP